MPVPPQHVALGLRVDASCPGFVRAGFGMSVRTRRTHLGPSVGSYGWNGGYGIIWYNDPAEDMTAILMHQGGAGRPRSPVFLDFFTAAYQAIDD
jgi:CubicO group peptidase (beta-lactamase class C family)